MSQVLEMSYRPRGAARELFRCDAPEILFEGPAGTGKTRGVLEWINGRAEMNPDSRHLICRATRASMTESVLVTLERDVLRPDMPGMVRGVSRSHRDSYLYENGSVIVVGGLDNPERLFSTEWDTVYVAEAIEITEDAWEKFARAMRSQKVLKRDAAGLPIEPVTLLHQRIADCNPGAPGHWLNQRAKRGAMVRLRSRHEDNPSITPDYLDALRNLTGHRRARLYEGKWVAAEGGVFPEFSEERHVIRPFRVPEDWPIYWAYDAGFDHPTCILWLAVGPNETLYVIDEIYRSGLGVAEHARTVRAREQAMGRIPRRRYADPQHCFSRTAQSPRTIAQQWRDCGFTLMPWPRTGGNEETMVEAVRQRLTQVRLKVFTSCVNTIREFQSWSYKRTVTGELPPGEDKYEDRENDAMDCIKGVVAARPTFAQPRISIE